MPKKLFLVDGSNHAFRVQYALPPQHASDGFPTRVLYGFTLLFQKMMNAYRPDFCAVSFDSGKSFRHETFPDYKGHRPGHARGHEAPMAVASQAGGGIRVRCVQAEGFEADDVIGEPGAALRLASPDVDVYIVSSDKDFAQLMGPNVHLLDEGKAGKGVPGGRHSGEVQAGRGGRTLPRSGCSTSWHCLATPPTTSRACPASATRRPPS